MLKGTLLTTTALVLCASLSLAGQNGAPPKSSPGLARMLGRAAHGVNNAPAIVRITAKGSRPVRNTPPNLDSAIFSNYSKDANAQYISWYGYSVGNYSSCSASSIYCWHVVENHALAFTPPTDVMTKRATIPLFSLNQSAQYEVDIYSSVGGLPGAVIAHSKQFTASDTNLCCTASRTVTIKANLVAGTQYFIGVVGICCNAKGGWNMENTDFSGAAVDYYHYKTTATPTYFCEIRNHCSSPWHASTAYPTTGAVVLK